MAHPLGVCSWSLQPRSPEDLVEKVRACGLGAVQLALDPLRRGEWDEAGTVDTLRRAGVHIASGMMAMAGEDYSTLVSIRRTGGVRPEATWPENLGAAGANAALARRLGLTLVTFHAGFIPHEPGDPERPAMIERLNRLAEVFAACGVRVAFETGQETADTLLAALRDLPGCGVNFDPANMILYGMGDPVASLRMLTPRVEQVHVKDAVPTRRPGEWGRETPAGSGAVAWREFFGVVRERLPGVGLMIEREAGGNRIDDIRAGAELVRAHLEVERD